MRYASFTIIVFSLLLLNAPNLAGQGSIQLTALNSMERILQHEVPFGNPVAKIAAARNEVESFQVVVAAQGRDLRVTSVKLTELVGPGGAKITSDNIKLYREEYVRVRRSSPRSELPTGMYPDALVPFIDPITDKPIPPFKRRYDANRTIVTSGYEIYALPFEVCASLNQALWIDLHVPEDVPAGVYNGTVQIVAGKEKAELPVALTVWDFNLPDGPTHCNSFGSFSRVAPLFDVKRNSDEFRAIEMRYCQAMADHRLTPPLLSYLLPQTNPDGSLIIDPERHKALLAFIDELHVKDFRIPRSPFKEREKTLRYYRDYYQYVKSNGWADRAYVYLRDEPNSIEQYEQVIAAGKIVHEAVPELQCLVTEQTYPHDPSWPDIDPAVDIWCPLWSFIDRESINQKLKKGDSVWSYTALVQRSPRYHPQYEEVGKNNPPYWHIDRPLLVYRVPTWINRQYDITGLLYWSTVTTVLDPWHNPAFARSVHYNGGGYLFYPGVPCGMRGPVASMRLKNLRDGMEDYEYFALLDQRAGAAAVRKIIDRIAPNWWEYTRDPKALYDARAELAAAILTHQ